MLIVNTMVNQSPTSLHSANAAMREGNYEEAVRLYSDLLQKYPSLLEIINFNIALAKRKLGNSQEFNQVAYKHETQQIHSLGELATASQQAFVVDIQRNRENNVCVIIKI